MAQESISEISVDDFYFSALSQENGNENGEITEIFPISDAKYAEELQFQEVLMSSVIASQNQNNNNDSSSSDPPLAIQESPDLLNPELIEKPKEVGQSSHSFCEICFEKKDSDEMFRIESCCHSYCTGCISKHVAAKIQDSVTAVMCPGLECKGVLEVGDCGPMISKDVLARWDEVLCESLLLASQKFYCPFKDCSAMLVNDGDELITESECPICNRLFCAQCYVPWHSGIECEEFQRLNVDERGREDLMVRELAREKNWRRCPHCKFYVEKTEGCLHMTCRCGFQFCYACGGTWSSTHGGCQ